LRFETYERLGFYQSTLNPEAPGDRAAAHMSLHLNRQCQRADAHPPPVRLFRASVVPTKKRRETVADPLGAVAVAGGAYMCGPRMRQRLFVQSDQKTGLA